MGILYVPLLAHLGSTGQQDYQGVSIPTKIYPVTWAKLYPPL